MAFAFKKKESVREAVKRLGRSKIETALRSIRHCEQGEAVHAVRKEIKRLRAFLRLVRSAMAPSDYCNYSNILREATRHLSAARDAHVKVIALAELSHHFEAELARRPFHKIKGMLLADCRTAQTGLFRARSPRNVERLLKKLAGELRSVNLKESGWTAIAPGIKRSYRDGRRGYQSAGESATPANFHQWRRRVKDLYYQVELLCPIWPEQMAAMATELKRLGQCLGDGHDLVLLTEPGALDAFRREAEDEAEALKGLVDQRQDELRTQSLAIGARFYAEKPSAICKCLGLYWKRWRHEPKRIRKSWILQNQ